MAANNLMDEMAKTLARRRAQAEGGSQNATNDQCDGPALNDHSRKQWDAKHATNGSNSPSKDNNSDNSQRFVYLVNLLKAVNMHLLTIWFLIELSLDLWIVVRHK